MANNEEDERRANTVAISGTTFKVIAALVTAFVVGVTSVLWNIVLDHERLDERVTALWEFGPIAGDRFTAEDGKEVKDSLRSMQFDLHKHERLPHHSFAGQRLQALKEVTQTHSQELRYLRQELQTLRNINNGRHHENDGR